MKARILCAVVLLVPIVVVAQQSIEEPQVYQGGLRPTLADVYCAGFISSTRIAPTLTIIAAEDALGRVIYGEGEYVFLSGGRNAGVEVGVEYLVVRPTKDATHMQSFKKQNRILRFIGKPYQDLGRVRIQVVKETTATAQIVHACASMGNGDILIPYEERPRPEYKPVAAFDRFAPPSGLEQAMVVAAKDFPALIGTGVPIYVNLGTTQGVKVGDYFRIFRYGMGTLWEGGKRAGMGGVRGPVAEGYQPTKRRDLPREVLGEALVIHVDANSSTALVTFALAEIHPGDYVELQPPVPPSASLVVEPKSIQRGEAALLSWTTAYAKEREISPGIGAVNTRGTLRVLPTQTTTYHLVARGPGGSVEATATVTVVEPPPPPPPPPAPPPAPVPAPTPSLDELFANNVQDIFFDFDSSGIRPEARATLEHVAEFLKAYPQVGVLIEGHCDEIGTREYNLRLGTQRAEAAREVLISLGVDAGRLTTVSLGKDRPFCTTSSEEACRQLNRRAHFLRQ